MAAARRGKRRDFVEALLREMTGHPEWERSAGPQTCGYRSFPATAVPQAALDTAYRQTFGRDPRGGAFGDVAYALKGVHEGGRTDGLWVYEEGLRYYLETGDPYMGWSSSIDRHGNDINAHLRRKD